MCDKEGLEKLQIFIEQSNDKQTNEIKQHIDREIAEIKKVLEEEKAKRNELEKQFKDLKEKYCVLEKSLRKNNIVIFGVDTKPESSLLDNTLDVMNSHLKLNLMKQDINNIYTIGKQTQNKPIVVKLVSFLTKIEIFKAAKNLKGTGIVISEELTIEERKRNKILRQHQREARERGLTAYIKKNILHVNGETYTAEQLADNERDTDSEESEESKEEERKTDDNTQTNSNKRSNNEIKEKKENLTHQKKRKIIDSVTQRSSPRLNDREEMQKSTGKNKESNSK